MVKVGPKDMKAYRERELQPSKLNRIHAQATPVAELERTMRIGIRLRRWRKSRSGHGHRAARADWFRDSRQRSSPPGNRTEQAESFRMTRSERRPWKIVNRSTRSSLLRPRFFDLLCADEEHVRAGHGHHDSDRRANRESYCTGRGFEPWSAKSASGSSSAGSSPRTRQTPRKVRLARGGPSRFRFAPAVGRQMKAAGHNRMRAL